VPQQNTQTNPGQVQPGTSTTTPPTDKEMKPINMTEAQWAVKFEEKVLKKGYQPTQEELAKYEDIKNRYQANPKVNPSIMEMLAAQSSMLGSQISSMRNAPAIAEQYKAIHNSVKTGGGIKGTLPPLSSLGMTALKSSGLAGLISGG